MSLQADAGKAMTLQDFVEVAVGRAGAAHDAVLAQGPGLAIPTGQDPVSQIQRLVELGVATPSEAEKLRDLMVHAAGTGSAAGNQRLIEAAAALHGAAGTGRVVAAIAGVIAASARGAAVAATDASWGTVLADAGGAVLGGVSGAIAGEMVAGKVGAVVGGVAGAIVVGGMVSHDHQHH
jgi:hypothetical protein